MLEVFTPPRDFAEVASDLDDLLEQDQRLGDQPARKHHEEPDGRKRRQPKISPITEARRGIWVGKSVRERIMSLHRLDVPNERIAAELHIPLDQVEKVIALQRNRVPDQKHPTICIDAEDKRWFEDDFREPWETSQAQAFERMRLICSRAMNRRH